MLTMSLQNPSYHRIEENMPTKEATSTGSPLTEVDTVPVPSRVRQTGLQVGQSPVPSLPSSSTSAYSWAFFSLE